jgi:hypothetical protein
MGAASLYSAIVSNNLPLLAALELFGFSSSLAPWLPPLGNTPHSGIVLCILSVYPPKRSAYSSAIRDFVSQLK